jgi:hypothetical protein
MPNAPKRQPTARARKRNMFRPQGYLLEDRRLLSVGVNLTFSTPYDADPMWVDLTKAFREWNPYANVWDGATPVPTTSQGYPLVDASSFVALAHNPTGVYQFSYQGTGNFTFSGAGALQGPVVRGPDGISRGTVLVTRQNVNLYIYVNGVDPNNPLHDVHLILPGYSADTTQVYTDQFLHSLQPFDTIRFMNWTMTNGSAGK